MERETLIEIGRIISDGDEAVLEELTACAADPAAYFAAHEEQYRERAIDSPEEPDLIRWIGMVDILEARNFVCERDWKDEKEDFFYFFSNLAGIRRLQLEMDPDWLDEDGDIEQWCGILDEKWSSRQCCAAAIGIDSDSFVLFPCTLAQLERLRGLAETTDYSIEKV